MLTDKEIYACSQVAKDLANNTYGIGRETFDDRPQLIAQRMLEKCFEFSAIPNNGSIIGWMYVHPFITAILILALIMGISESIKWWSIRQKGG